MNHLTLFDTRKDYFFSLYDCNAHSGPPNNPSFPINGSQGINVLGCRISVLNLLWILSLLKEVVTNFFLFTVLGEYRDFDEVK